MLSVLANSRPGPDPDVRLPCWKEFRPKRPPRLHSDRAIRGPLDGASVASRHGEASSSCGRGTPYTGRHSFIGRSFPKLVSNPPSPKGKQVVASGQVLVRPPSHGAACEITGTHLCELLFGMARKTSGATPSRIQKSRMLGTPSLRSPVARSAAQISIFSTTLFPPCWPATSWATR